MWICFFRKKNLSETYYCGKKVAISVFVLGKSRLRPCRVDTRCNRRCSRCSDCCSDRVRTSKHTANTSISAIRLVKRTYRRCRISLASRRQIPCRRDRIHRGVRRWEICRHCPSASLHHRQSPRRWTSTRAKILTEKPKCTSHIWYDQSSHNVSQYSSTTICVRFSHSGS